MIHNVVVVDGEEYKAVKLVSEKLPCYGCSFSTSALECESDGAPCTMGERADGEHVIYKPHYKLNHNSEV